MGKKETAKRLEKMNTQKWQEIANSCSGRTLPEKNTDGLMRCALIQGECRLENCVPWHWRFSE